MRERAFVAAVMQVPNSFRGRSKRNWKENLITLNLLRKKEK